MSRLSIRWRLTLWSSLTLGFLLLGLGGFVYALVRHAMVEQLDNALLTRLGEFPSPIDRADHTQRLRHWLDELHEHADVLGVVYDSSGQVLARTESLSRSGIPARPNDIEREPSFHTMELPQRGRHRMLTASLGPDQEFDIVLLLYLGETDRELSQVSNALWTVFPVALFLAGVMGYVLAGRALAPIGTLRRATNAVTADRLDRRLDIANPDDELGKLGSTINSMIHRLEQSFAEVRRFTADASHELRTPIAIIRAEAEVAVRRSADTDGAFSNILEECEYLTRLTDQLLTLSREDAGLSAMETEPLDFAELVRQASQVMRPLAQSKRQTLTIDVADESILVRGNAVRLRQVVYNLLDNSMKYTSEGRLISITVGSAEGHATLVIRDNGPGIDANHLPHVTKRFYRIDKARSRAEGGTGLGLSIVSSICSAHGGSLEITSQPGEGTTCTVRLPLETAS